MFKLYQTWIFFGALCANIRDFKIHDGNFTTGSLSFLGRIRNSYRFVKFWSKKGLEFLDLLSFFLLEFSQKWSKKSLAYNQSNALSFEKGFFDK